MARFFIPAGDMRQIYLEELLKKNGFSVASLCRPEKNSPSLKAAMADSEVILGPVPFTKNTISLFHEDHQTPIEIEHFLSLLRKDHILFGGNLPEQVKSHCRLRKIRFYDYMKMEEVALKNTIATAEGALSEAICLSCQNLHKSRCLVAGFGRCGHTLALKLKGLSACVSVTDHSRARLALAEAAGFDALPMKELKNSLSSCDFLFNTIPDMVFAGELLKHFRKNTVMIDLASSPGGVDHLACKRAGIKTKHCPGLPGIYSPFTSAEILYEAIMEHL